MAGSPNGPMPQVQQNQIIPNPSPNFTSPTVSNAAASQVIGVNAVRRGIIFANPSSSVTLYVAPLAAGDSPSLAIGQGVPILPGALFPIYAQNNVQVNTAWQAIASTGSSNNLTILEFV